ncbi:MAG: Ig-like domain-containing protein [Flavobacteriia bacterium]|nr:Ig-like domain-containing protein [Flavobacteriia bacterium]
MVRLQLIYFAGNFGMLKRGLKYIILLTWSIIMTACAVQSSPDGGAKDTTPPEAVRVEPPNRTTNFEGQSVAITFDEYVKVDGFTSQFISSPPLKYKVEHSLRGKTLRIEFQDTLRPNTTYTFSFGNAIKDITENNAQTEFKYVFSTGAVLDSQIVRGRVTDAFTNEAQKGIMVAMYEPDSEDSVFMKEVPLYYGLTNATGSYTIENVAPGNYKIFAIQDNDFNYLWSGPSERMAFVDEIITSERDPEVDFELFKLPAAYRFYRGKLLSFGKIEAYFSSPAQGVEFTRLDTSNAQHFVEYPENGDTIFFYTNQWKDGEQASWSVYDEATSSLDTMTIRFIEKDTVKFKLNLEKTSAFSPADSIISIASTPITELDESRVFVYRNDSVPIPFTVTQSGPRRIRLSVDAQYNDRLRWVLDSGAVKDLHGRWNDSTSQGLRFLADNELSIFHLVVKSDSLTTRVVEIYNDKGNVAYRSGFTQQINIDLFDIEPQKYHVRVIYDRNGNGKWDTGGYFNRTQPERVIYLDKTIELRANWEIDETWIIP